MTELTLMIGNKNYSSWSLRPWVLMKQAGIPFRERLIPLRSAAWESQIQAVSPSGRVPALHDGDLRIWDSLAICEYLAERHPEKQLWPGEPAARAAARSVSAEMHSGFQALRQHMFMNIRRRWPDHGRDPEALLDVGRITQIWNDCRSHYSAGGPFLFGTFTIADAMYAPIPLRFQTYGVSVDGPAGEYARTLLALPAMQEWVAAAHAEQEKLTHYERNEA